MLFCETCRYEKVRATRECKSPIAHLYRGKVRTLIEVEVGTYAAGVERGALLYEWVMPNARSPRGDVSYDALVNCPVAFILDAFDRK